MKKILTSILLLFMLIFPVVVFAQTSTGAAPTDGDVKKRLDQLFQIQIGAGNKNVEDAADRIKSSKEATFSDFFAGVIKIMTGVAVIMTFVGVVVAGIIFVFSEGEESRTTKAKNILMYVAIGDLIITLSYAVVKAITLINPLK